MIEPAPAAAPPPQMASAQRKKPVPQTQDEEEDLEEPLPPRKPAVAEKVDDPVAPPLNVSVLGDEAKASKKKDRYKNVGYLYVDGVKYEYFTEDVEKHYPLQTPEDMKNDPKAKIIMACRERAQTVQRNRALRQKRSRAAAGSKEKKGKSKKTKKSKHHDESSGSESSSSSSSSSGYSEPHSRRESSKASVSVEEERDKTLQANFAKKQAEEELERTKAKLAKEEADKAKISQRLLKFESQPKAASLQEVQKTYDDFMAVERERARSAAERIKTLEKELLTEHARRGDDSQVKQLQVEVEELRKQLRTAQDQCVLLQGTISGLKTALETMKK